MDVWACQKTHTSFTIRAVYGTAFAKAGGIANGAVSKRVQSATRTSREMLRGMY